MPQTKPMKRINFFTFDDILHKRTIKSFNRQNDISIKNNKRISTQDEEFQINQNELLMNIMQEFKSNKKNFVPNFSNEIKTHIVQLMSKKMNLKLNANKMLTKMKIKKIQNIEIIQKLNHKNHSQNTMSQSKKLDCLIRRSSKGLLNPKRLSYFLLNGSIHIYEKQQLHLRKKSHDQEQPSNDMKFFNWKQFDTQYPTFKKLNTFGQFTGFGNAFMSKPSNDEIHQSKTQYSSFKQSNFLHPHTHQQTNKNPQMIIAQDAIFVEIQSPQQGDDFINHTGMEYEKMTGIIENFPIFKSLGRKIRNFVQFFQFKEYHRNQQIYGIGDSVEKFYLLLKGEIVFEHNKTNPIQTAVTSPKASRKNSLHMQMNIKTQTMSSGSYFGQEQMIFQKQQRVLAARCKSSKCQILQIPKERFQKMLQYSDFYQCIKKAAETKFLQRLSKLEKNQQIRTKFALTQTNQQKNQEFLATTHRPTDRQTIPLFGSPKKSLDGRYRVMHGNVIRQFSQQQKQKMSETVQFSMLRVNPDMYEKTVDKFRKYNIKPQQKYKPQVNWQLKRVWKVLNLENILREQAEISSPQGRKFYDSHKRYMYHLKESKSMRPKTTSSTYRTKLQYIAYLQQFKGDNNS